MKYKFGTWNIRGLAGSVRDAERKTYEFLNILARYGILTETKHHGGSYEEVRGTKHVVGPENGERNHHGVALVVKAALWADWGGQ